MESIEEGDKFMQIQNVLQVSIVVVVATLLILYKFI